MPTDKMKESVWNMPEAKGDHKRKRVSSDQFFKRMAVPVRLRTHRYGTLKMRGPTIRDIEFLNDLFKQNLPPSARPDKIVCKGVESLA